MRYSLHPLIKREPVKGFDFELLTSVSELSNVPIIISGGYGNSQHSFVKATECGADAVAVADALHYGRKTISELNK